jgi:hypothetical protein
MHEPAHDPAGEVRPTPGMPIEEAPLWALAIFAAVLWPIVFVALVGLLNGLRLVAGGGWTVAGAALAITLLLVAGLATRKRWKRPGPRNPAAQPPPFARFSAWLWATVLVPNVLFGALMLFQFHQGLGYAEAIAIGLLVSAIHGAFALAERWRRRRRGAPSP